MEFMMIKWRYKERTLGSLVGILVGWLESMPQAKVELPIAKML